MNLRPLLAAAAASVLAAGAAHAQAGSAQPGTDETPNRATPAPATESSTGLPSVDSSRPIRSGAGATRVPNGEVGVSATTDSTGASLGTASGTTSAGVTADATTTTADAAASATTTAADASTSASVTTSMTTNGPVPDTAENRAKYGQPLSRAGKRTAARGN
ncbi:hypothetical protein [Phenylobacterium sp.]|uniref:hypothetical protein n=1 Tax=Phenylobacterium sp. TaxID=1871053 RepID=UPI002FE07E14